MPNPADIERLRQQQRLAAIQKNAGTLGLGQGGLDYFSSSRDRFERYKRLLAQRQGDGTAQQEAPPPVEDDPIKRFLDSIKEGLPQGSGQTITPFDQSGFYNDTDARALSDQEYDPFYTRQKTYQDAQNTEEDRQRLEQVAASGGNRSSAYERERQLRTEALGRASEGMSNEQKAEKERFRLSRRNEAYQRYLQSTGALTTT